MTSDAEIGWIAAIIIGGIAGWLAEQFMKSDMGLLMNIVLGDRRRGDRQRHSQYIRDRARRLDRLPDPRLYRRLYIDLDRPHGQGPHSLRLATP